MTEKQKSNKKWIWLLVLLLFIGAAATTVAVWDRFDGFLMDDDGAISLTPETDATGTKDGVGSATKNESGYHTAYENQIMPGFEASSNGDVWEAKTDIELFHISYKDGKHSVTVEGSDGEKVIAPGTESSFVFKLKNTGNVAMDYDVQVETYVEPEGTIIPIKGRLSRYDGEWVAGDQMEHVDITNVEKMQDSATLGVGRYLYYTLDWVWPFEQGTDSLDTMLGNQALREEITFTVRVKTISEISSNPEAAIGIMAPDTGDRQPIVIWIAAGVAALCLLAVLLYYRKKEQEEDPAEAEVKEREEE